MQTRQKIRFAILSCACICALVCSILIQPSPKPDVIDWTPYSTSAIQNDLDNGKIVLVSVVARWHYSTMMHEYRYSQSPAVLDLINANQISCYQMDLAELSNGQLTIWQKKHGSDLGMGLLLLKKNIQNDLIMRRLTQSETSIEKVIFEIELGLTNQVHSDAPR